MQSSGNHPDQKKRRRKAKRNRRKTECSVIRRDRGCGICGSENIALQGVLYCEICELESEPFLIQTRGYFTDYGVKVPCRCVGEWTFKGRIHTYRKTKSIGVYKCMDCGSVGKEAFCPNNGSGNHGYSSMASTCWKHWSGETFCQVCGFRSKKQERG